MSINYDENHRVIEKTATTTFHVRSKLDNKNRVKFFDEEPAAENTETNYGLRYIQLSSCFDQLENAST